MIDLGRHIEVLLLDNDCVVVPGLGGFVAHHVGARYDERDGSYLPPMRTLGFNTKLNVNDSLLAQAYMETYDISYPEAAQRIADEVDEIRRQIDTEGFYEFEGIGTLTTTNGDNYEFEPCEAGILTPELYGLYSLNIADLKSTGGSMRNRGHVTTGILAAAAAIIIFIIFVLSPRMDSDGNETNTLKAEWKSPVEWISDIKISLPSWLQGNAPTNERETEEEQPAVENTAVTQKDTIAKPVEQSQTEEETKAEENIPYYTIVLACRVSTKNANAFAEQMTNDGYENVVVMGEGKDLKVIYGRFETEGKAYSTLNRLHSRRPFVEAWVYKVKP